jgi:hypothetical protein
VGILDKLIFQEVLHSDHGQLWLLNYPYFTGGVEIWNPADPGSILQLQDACPGLDNQHWGRWISCQALSLSRQTITTQIIRSANDDTCGVEPRVQWYI